VRRYGSEPNQRWTGFEHRPGDIVISTRSKCGTTLAQMMCAILVFGTPDLPTPLSEISPWLDWDVEPVEAVHRRLADQDHRRIIKTHTPLDGLPLHPDVTYLVVGRHPLDVAVSLYHHAANIDRRRFSELSGKPPSAGQTGTLLDHMRRWIDPDVPVDEELDTLPGLLHHVADAWRRRDQPNVVLLHYRDLTQHPAQEMGHLAERLGVGVAEHRWPELVDATSFRAMKNRAAWLAPDRLGVLTDRDAFFRGGRSGDGTELLGAADVERYARRLAELAEPDVVAWLHCGEVDGPERSPGPTP
jgi:hypothetical protein